MQDVRPALGAIPRGRHRIHQYGQPRVLAPRTARFFDSFCNRVTYRGAANETGALCQRRRSMASEAQKSPQSGRRVALLLIGGGTAAFACALAVPAIKVIAAPVRVGGGGERWVKTVKLDSLAEGAPKKVAIVADEKDA